MSEGERLVCAECGTGLEKGADAEVTDSGTFCRPCFNNLTAQLTQALADQGRDINYPLAFIGAAAGASIGVLAWWMRRKRRGDRPMKVIVARDASRCSSSH